MTYTELKEWRKEVRAELEAAIKSKESAIREMIRNSISLNSCTDERNEEEPKLETLRKELLEIEQNLTAFELIYTYWTGRLETDGIFRAHIDLALNLGGVSGLLCSQTFLESVEKSLAETQGKVSEYAEAIYLGRDRLIETGKVEFNQRKKLGYIVLAQNHARVALAASVWSRDLADQQIAEARSEIADVEKRLVVAASKATRERERKARRKALKAVAA